MKFPSLSPLSSKQFRYRLAPLAMAAVLSVGAPVAMAQAAPGDPGYTGSSWLPFTTNGYVGLSGGRSNFDRDCIANFSCERHDTAWKVYTGGKFRDMVGVEVSYLDLGELERGGGNARTRGIGVSALGNVPLGDVFSLFGKAGTTYGRTNTSTSVLGGDSGRESGWGLNYGAGMEFKVARNFGLRLEWERQRFQFIGGKSDVDMATAGVKFIF